MQRRALIASNSAGAPEGASGVLARFGFTRTVNVNDRDAALAQMRESRFDLVIVPVDQITPPDLIALEREIRRDPTVSVIATAATPDADLIVRAMRAGVHEFLLFPPKPEELAGSVERLMRRMQNDVQRGELIAVYSGKGGLGNTSIAVNLAYAYASANSNSRVAIADLVAGGGDVRVFLNLKPLYDISHLIEKGSHVDAELLNSVLTPCPGGVWALPTGDSPEDNDMFDSSSVTSILTVLKHSFSVTIVDCEHALSEATITAFDAADKIVLVTQLNVPALRSTQRSLSVCRRLGYDDSKLCIVVNRHQSGDVLPAKDAESLLQAPIFWKLPNDYRLSAASLTKGVPAVVEEPASKLARSYGELVKKLGGTVSGSYAKMNEGGASRFRRLFAGRD